MQLPGFNWIVICSIEQKFHLTSLTTLKYKAKVAIDKEILQMQILRYAGKSLYSDLNLKESHLCADILFFF